MKPILLVLVSMFFSLNLFAQTGAAILPSDTDPSITNPNNAHYGYYNTTITHKNKLFLFLPGTGGTPFGYQEILKTAADLGYHAIGLMYPNAQAINSICAPSTDTTCHRFARQEVLEGIDVHPTVSVDRTNSIENRLIKLLKYLHVQYPSLGWDQFLTNDSILVWDKFVVSGHSQGGGHAGYIGKVRHVDRVNMFSATDWIPLSNRNADWITMPGLTPISEYYALIHDQDEQIPFAIEQTTWQNYEMYSFGSDVLVDTAVTPYSDSRTLFTQLIPAISSTAYHNSTVVDGFTPDNGFGDPELENVWEYMIDGGGLSTAESSSFTHFVMFPNPASEFIVVNANYPFQYFIQNIAGSKIEAGSSKDGIIELAYPPGLYFISIFNGEGSSAQKLIIR